MFSHKTLSPGSSRNFLFVALWYWKVILLETYPVDPPIKRRDRNTSKLKQLNLSIVMTLMQSDWLIHNTIMDKKNLDFYHLSLSDSWKQVIWHPLLAFQCPNIKQPVTSWCLLEAWCAGQRDSDFRTRLQTLQTGWSCSLYLHYRNQNYHISTFPFQKHTH